MKKTCSKDTKKHNETSFDTSIRAKGPKMVQNQLNFAPNTLYPPKGPLDNLSDERRCERWS